MIINSSLSKFVFHFIFLLIYSVYTKALNKLQVAIHADSAKVPICHGALPNFELPVGFIHDLNLFIFLIRFDLLNVELS